MAIPRGKPGGRKKSHALTGVTRRDVGRLESLAHLLNGDRWRRGDGEIPAECREHREVASDVIAAIQARPWPEFLTNEAATRFNALARGAPVEFRAYDEVASVDPADLPFHVSFQESKTKPFGNVTMATASPAAVWALWIALYVDNPQRERLRRCPVCRRWFADTTRNRSAEHCSRSCTLVTFNQSRRANRARARKKGHRP
jgi:hypothetical protein